MTTLQQQCQQCQETFAVYPEEAQLRDRIGTLLETGPVPTPTICPDCRIQQKAVWRNERSLHHRRCDKTGKNIISVYDNDVVFPVYDRHVWWSDEWDAQEFGRPFDWQQPFFDQYKALQAVVPRPALNTQNVENCDFCNFAFDSRNCYLSQCCYFSESLLYSFWSLRAKDCIDCSYCFESEQCYECTDCNHAYGCLFCQLCHNSHDCIQCYDCRGCEYCFGCVGLRKQSYCLFNEQLSREEYDRQRAEFDLQNPQHRAEIENRVAQLQASQPHLYSIQEKNENCTGDYIFESRNCHNCFQVYRSEDCINVQDAETNTSLDDYHAGWSEGTYCTYSAVRQNASAFCIQCWDGAANFYSDNCISCSHCFGCIGLKHKEYCILNQQYREEEYKQLLPKMVDHLKSTNEWGQFFPVTLSPFAYNETAAQDLYPLTKAQVQQRGWHWRETDDQLSDVKKIIPADRLPQRIADIPDDILNWAVRCERTGRPFKIIKPELEFYRLMQLPIPHLHPDERYKRRNALRNPRKLWQRNCDQCQREMMTTYSPDRSEKVYCEECYLQAVY